MNTASTCPEPQELRQLLDGSLSQPRQQECTDHLDACECCQAKLEEMATDGTRLVKLCKHFERSDPEVTSAYWPALKAIGAETPPVSTVRTPTRTRELALDFLAPASDAVYLGRLGQFDVMRVVGRGGMGVVLEAFDSRLHRHVAVKILDPELASDEVARQRFCREARAAASITHENVVAVHQVEKSGDGGLPYMVMQLVNGESLEDRLQRQPLLPTREVVRIGMQAAHGLEAAHAQGLIHRDIKPGNILLEAPHDRVKLTDFGLARATHDVKLTQSGFVSGTPLYMAPEQVMGQEADQRSDLFSLGAVLYEMCAGRPPFAGDSALVILRQVAEEKPRPVRELNPAIPGWLAETIDRLLAKKPADRIQTAAQLAELFDYEWALMKTSSEEVPTVCQEAANKRAKRTRWIAGGVGAAFLTIGLVGGKFLARNYGLPTSSAPPAYVLSAKAGSVWSVAFNPEGDTVAMAVEDGSVRLWDLQTQSIKAKFEAHRGVVWNSKFSTQGDWLATAGDDGLVKLWNVSQPEAFKSFAHPNAVRGFALAHDDRTLFAGGREGGLHVWSLDSTEPIMEADHPGAVYSVAISPDDATLATAGNDDVVRIWNAKTLTQKLRLEGHNGPVYSVFFHPKGRRVASAGWDATVRIWDTASGQLAKSWKGHEGDIWAVVYSPDGSKLATGGFDGAVKLWDAETGDLLATYLGHKVAIHALAFNREGTLLASGGRDGAVRIWTMR
ncbi:MAG TPA: serine/threonine-protein kinase [Pirellulales bacterium]|jgi:serine/threonine protein kinase|nr:serine/threonine-protein kinase [Pirellulales bacterium]